MKRNDTRPLVAACLLLARVCVLITPVVANAGVTVPFTAARNLAIGYVEVSVAGPLDLRIQLVDAGWRLSDTHLYVGTKRPEKTAPGRFPFHHPNLGFPKADTFTIALQDLGAACGDTIHVAVHGVVREYLGGSPDFAALEELLTPTGALATVSVDYPGPDSYFLTEITDERNVSGSYDGWCVDTSRTITPGVVYTATLTSSLDPAAYSLVDHPANLDLLNYVINQPYEYGWRDRQRAIWMLVEDELSSAGIEGFNQANADAIASDAYANGEGFLPGCDESVAVIVDPLDESGLTNAQRTIVGVDMPCLVRPGAAETAWALHDEGVSFTAKSGRRTGWGSYFEVTLCED